MGSLLLVCFQKHRTGDDDTVTRGRTASNIIQFSSGKMCNAGKTLRMLLAIVRRDASVLQLSLRNTVISVTVFQVGCGFVWVQ